MEVISSPWLLLGWIDGASFVWDLGFRAKEARCETHNFRVHPHSCTVKELGHTSRSVGSAGALLLVESQRRPNCRTQVKEMYPKGIPWTPYERNLHGNLGMLTRFFLEDSWMHNFCPWTVDPGCKQTSN